MPKMEKIWPPWGPGPCPCMIMMYVFSYSIIISVIPTLDKWLFFHLFPRLQPLHVFYWNPMMCIEIFGHVFSGIPCNSELDFSCCKESFARRILLWQLISTDHATMNGIVLPFLLIKENSINDGTLPIIVASSACLNENHTWLLLS